MTGVVANHEYWMACALRLARQGLYSTHPNPRVGCIIVRDGKQAAAGFHEFPGGPHAEINALTQLDGTAEDCTVYITLEPCSHTGKTPPCVDALIEAMPQRVVIAMQDPNPMVSGNGVTRLQQAGIDVVQDVLKLQAMELNTGFIKRMTQQRPWIRVKMAMSLDGRTALANGVSQWITGESARHDVQYLRARSSAILSTAKTVISDDASLNVRLNSQQLGQTVPVRQPVRVVLDENLELTGRERLFTIPGKIWIFTCSTDQELIENLQSSSVKIFNLPPGADGLMDLNKLMLLLAEYEINEVHTECGATLAGALLKRQLVDELVVYQAPKLLGSAARGLVDLGEISIMSDTIQLNLRDVRNIGDDIRITAAPEYPCLPS